MEKASTHNLEITRVIDAPLERVWSAWTDARELQEWWGPRGVSNPTCTWEASPGGAIFIIMVAGDELGELAGQEWPMTGTFQEVEPMQRLVFSSQALVDGRPVLDTLCSVVFADKGDGKTQLTVGIEVTRSTQEAKGPLSGMEQGWNESLDKLMEYVQQ